MFGKINEGRKLQSVSECISAVCTCKWAVIACFPHVKHCGEAIERLTARRRSVSPLGREDKSGKSAEPKPATCFARSAP